MAAQFGKYSIPTIPIDTRPKWQQELATVLPTAAKTPQTPVNPNLTYGRTAVPMNGVAPSSPFVGGQSMMPMKAPAPAGSVAAITPAPSKVTSTVTSRTSTPTAPVAPAPQAPAPTPGSAAAAAEAWKWQDYETPEEKALRERAEGYKTDMNQVVDYDALYAQQLARQQAEIDSTNALYNDMLIQSRINNAKIYERRANSTAAIAANQGLVGSNIGEGMVRETESANMAEQAAAEAVINEQRAQQIAAIRKEIRKSAEAELRANREARAKGAEATIENVKSRQSRRLDSASKAIKAYLAAGVDVLSLDEKQRKDLLGDIGLPDKELRDAIETLAAEDRASKASGALSGRKTESEIAENLAQAKKLESDVANWGKMTDYQKQQITIERERLAKSADPKKESAETAAYVQQMTDAINESLATSSGDDDIPGDYLSPAQYKELRSQWVRETQKEPTVFDAYFADRAYTNQVDKKSKYSYASYGIVPRETGKIE